MQELRLIKPNVELQQQYIEMLEEWKKKDGENTPWFINFDISNFSEMVNKLEGFSKGIGVEDGFVENSTLWLIDNTKRIIGAVNIRHRLNNYFQNFGGQIGYGIRPDERRKGYAKEILRLALEVLKEMGYHKTLLCCYKDNIASVKTIVGNGGVLDSEGLKDGIVFQRYWIDIK